MPEYKLTGRARRIIGISSRYQARNPEALTDDLIDDINNMTITAREARKVLCPSRNVITHTFVIPVTDGAITGYYFFNPRFSELAGVVPLIIFGSAVMLTQCRNLNAMMIGDAHAMDLGVDVRRVRILLLLMSSLVVAACVAFTGTIGFIGLVIPHIFRIVLGPDNRIIAPISLIGGAAFIIMCDYIAHYASQFFSVLPIGVVTAIIGAPFFIYLLCRKRRDVGW